MLAPGELIGLVVLGLFAGAIGGLVGVGGSIVIIPILTLLMSRDQHLSQAAAMIVNVFVAASALLRHHQAMAVRWDVVVRMLPFGVLFIIIGVEASNQIDGEILKKIYGGFLLYVIVFNVIKLFQDGGQSPDAAQPRIGWGPVGFIGGLMGLVAGLLGIGGGPIAMPLLQRICNLPLRQAIAASSAVMCLTSIVGAVRKNATLGVHVPARQPAHSRRPGSDGGGRRSARCRAHPHAAPAVGARGIHLAYDLGQREHARAGVKCPTMVYSPAL